MEVISLSDLEQITSRNNQNGPLEWEGQRREHLEKTREKVLPGREGWKDTWPGVKTLKHFITEDKHTEYFLKYSSIIKLFKNIIYIKPIKMTMNNFMENLAFPAGPNSVCFSVIATLEKGWLLALP